MSGANFNADDFARKRIDEMTDAPEKKWLTPNGGLPTGNGWHESELVEYTRTDIADARIAELEEALITTRALVVEGAVTGFNYALGDWADRLYQNNGNISNALRGHETGGVDHNGAADAILAALPELTAPKVKPLVWDKHPDENQWYNVLTDSNYGPEMGYTITETDCCHYKLNMRSGDEKVGKYPTFEAADGAAKSHMTHLIRSALVTQGEE